MDQRPNSQVGARAELTGTVLEDSFFPIREGDAERGLLPDDVTAKR